ncbi:MAG: hypothetical protein VYE58_03000 [Pseudomonadota bacterium]|nr:hypothetical protein [Pseudomonadota bacterium]
MRRILYNMEFKGRGEQETDGEMLWITRSFAPCVRFTTEIDADGVDARIEEVTGPQAEFNSNVTAHDGGECYGA